MAPRTLFLCSMAWTLFGALPSNQLGAQTPEAGGVVRFERGIAAVGETSSHLARSGLNAKSTRRHGDHVIDSRTQSMQQSQSRILHIMAVDSASQRPTRAELTYVSATKSVGVDGSVENQPEPVNNKRYVVERRGPELLVTTPEGDLPPPEELDIVTSNMQAFGIPNPLTNYLAEKTLRIGQTLSVPEDVARELLGIRSDDDKIERFDLRLRNRSTVEGEDCAVFTAILQTSRRSAGQSNAVMKGDIAVAIRSCRIKAMNLRGPIAITELRGSAAANYTEHTSGTAEISLLSRRQLR